MYIHNALEAALYGYPATVSCAIRPGCEVVRSPGGYLVSADRPRVSQRSSAASKGIGRGTGTEAARVPI